MAVLSKTTENVCRRQQESAHVRGSKCLREKLIQVCRDLPGRSSILPTPHVLRDGGGRGSSFRGASSARDAPQEAACKPTPRRGEQTALPHRREDAAAGGRPRDPEVQRPPPEVLPRPSARPRPRSVRASRAAHCSPYAPVLAAGASRPSKTGHRGPGTCGGADRRAAAGGQEARSPRVPRSGAGAAEA